MRLKPRGRWAAGAVVALGLLGARPVGAYVRTRTDRGVAIHWPQSCIYITAHVADPAPNLDSDLIVTAARGAAAAWSQPQVDCTSLQLQVSVSQSTDLAVANDKHSNLVFRQGSWCREPRDPNEPCYDSSALAITTVFAQQNDGVVLDADTEVNAVDFTWGDLVAGIGASGNVQDLQNTLTHEFGHLLGLDHNCHSNVDRTRGVDQNGDLVPDCNRAPADVQMATMYASVMRGDILRRTLSPDDVDGVCAIYPASGGPLCQEITMGEPPAQPGGDDGGSGGCTVGRGRPSTLVVVALALLVVARRRRGRRQPATNSSRA
jgi:hypothetical protein